MQKNVRKLVFGGLLIALAVVLTRLLSAKFPLIPGGMISLRLDPGYIPIMFSSLLLGPFFGAAVGGLADLLGFFMFPQDGPYFIGFTLTFALIGFIPGIFRNIIIKYKWLLPIVVTLVTMLASILNTIWLTYFLHVPKVILWPRLLSSLIMSVFYSIILYSLLRVLKIFKEKLK